VKNPEMLELLPERLPYGWKPNHARGVDRLYSLYTSGRENNPKLRRSHALIGSINWIELQRDLRTPAKAK
jgi:hypothetical protein